MTTIIDFHQLCRNELNELLGVRYMPTGWSRDGSRKRDEHLYGCRRTLDEHLQTVPSFLLAYPARNTIRQLCEQAVSERVLANMVRTWVGLMAKLPRADQETAHAVALLSDTCHSLSRIDSELDATIKRLTELRDKEPGAADIGLDELLACARNTLAAARRKSRDLSFSKDTLQGQLHAAA